MTIQAKVFSGRQDRFALELQVASDPDSGRPAEQDVWGEFALWVDGRSLSAHEDREGGRWNGIRWWLGRPLEWWVDCWDELLHEQRPPFMPARQAGSLVQEWVAPRDPPPGLSSEDADRWCKERHAFWRRHCLLAVRDGGPMPNVAILRRGDSVELSWTGRDEAGVGISYNTPEAARAVGVGEFAEVVHGFLRGASAELLRLAPTSQRWKKLSARVDAIDRRTDDQLVRRSGLLLGLEDRSGWETALQRLAGPVRELLDRVMSEAGWVGPGSLRCPEPVLMFGTLRPRPTVNDIARLLGEWAAAHHQGSTTDRTVDRVAISGLEAFSRAFEQGHEAARQLRETWSWSEEPLLDLEGRLAAQGIKVRDVELDDPSIPAVAMVGQQTDPTVLINGSNTVVQREWGRRMALAHELGHLVLDRDAARRVGIVEGPWVPLPVEQRARAFAAHLLMPERAVQRVIADEHLDLRASDSLRVLGDRFGVSWSAAAHHLVSLGLLESVYDADALLDRAVESCKSPAASSFARIPSSEFHEGTDPCVQG